ncbi:unnamed protein product, partial [Choristocarpus tenellus]
FTVSLINVSLIKVSSQFNVSLINVSSQFNVSLINVSLINVSLYICSFTIKKLSHTSLSTTHPITISLLKTQSLGQAYLPAAILVLAGSLVRGGSPKLGEPAPIHKSFDRAFAKKVSAIMAARFLIMPFLAAVMLMSGSRMGLIPYDKLLWFVMLMQGCMPSAQNSVVILQLENKPELAKSMGRTLIAIYLLAAIPIAFLLSGILQFVQL